MDRIKISLQEPLRGGSAESIRISKRGGNHFCVCVAIAVSIAILVLEIWCLVQILFSIKHLKQNGESVNESHYNSYSSTSSDIVQVPCNRSAPCNLLSGPRNTAELLKLMLGVRRQTQVRKKKSRNHLKQTLNVHFTLNQSHNQSLIWTHSLHGREYESDGTVTITENATYGLYNTFTLQSPRHGGDEVVEIQHQINLERPSEHYSPDALLKETIKLSPSPQSYVEHGFFEFVYLHEGDRIYPVLSNTSYIYNARHSSSWGLFQIT
ncbi:uncharacterized protein LOC117342902 [Pecten maximus]|uniref:uncharacterized protein LOC117342902 n=1 Tax=Pecten maximus TaxID=6579 RepID=UPI001457EF41|nr:uncharacterized protein LOC117342902 [Pecten maximus]